MPRPLVAVILLLLAAPVLAQAGAQPGSQAGPGAGTPSSLETGARSGSGAGPQSSSDLRNPVPTQPGNFVDTTARSGVHFTGTASHTTRKYLIETMGSGVAAFDFDNDGLLDLFFVNGAHLSDPQPKGSVPQKTGPADWNRLYHQKKDGTFEDVTEKAGLQGVGYGMGVAVGDYDNDGFEDLYVTAYGGNKLYHNNGNGTFTDVTVQSGTGGPTTSGFTWSTSAAWVDLDNDGLLDLVVLRYMQWDFDDVCCGEHREGYRAYCHPDIFPPLPALVYHNDGNGHFTEVAKKMGLDVPGKGLGIAIADFDRDGKVDLAVANDSMVEFLYRNKGDGHFEETGLMAEVAVDGDGRTFAGMGIDFADYNNDGLPDLVITNLANQKYALYRNNGDGSFTYDTYVSGLARMTLLHSGWGIRFLDYDNDGLKDILIAQGHDLDTVELNYPQLHYKEPMLLAHNIGKGGFVDVSAQSGAVFQQPWVSRGLAVGDLDNDGRIDAVVTTQRRPRPHPPQRDRDLQPLAPSQPRRPQVQPRRHRRRNKAHHQQGPAMGHGLNRRLLPLRERQARPLRPRPRHRREVDRDPLAQRHRPETRKRPRQPNPQDRRTRKVAPQPVIPSTQPGRPQQPRPAPLRPLPLHLSTSLRALSVPSSPPSPSSPQASPPRIPPPSTKPLPQAPSRSSPTPSPMPAPSSGKTTSPQPNPSSAPTSPPPRTPHPPSTCSPSSSTARTSPRTRSPPTPGPRPSSPPTPTTSVSSPSTTSSSTTTPTPSAGSVARSPPTPATPTPGTPSAAPR